MELPTPQRPKLPSRQPLSAAEMEMVKNLCLKIKKASVAAQSRFKDSLYEVVVLHLMVRGMNGSGTDKENEFWLGHIIVLAHSIGLALMSLLMLAFRLHHVYITHTLYAYVSRYLSISDADDTDEWALNKYQIALYLCLILRHFHPHVQPHL